MLARKLRPSALGLDALNGAVSTLRAKPNRVGTGNYRRQDDTG
jgi:hypothetical protein